MKMSLSFNGCFINLVFKIFYIAHQKGMLLSMMLFFLFLYFQFPIERDNTGAKESQWPSFIYPETYFIDKLSGIKRTFVLLEGQGHSVKLNYFFIEDFHW